MGRARENVSVCACACAFANVDRPDMACGIYLTVKGMSLTPF